MKPIGGLIIFFLLFFIPISISVLSIFLTWQTAEIDANVFIYNDDVEYVDISVGLISGCKYTATSGEVVSSPLDCDNIMYNAKQPVYYTVTTGRLTKVSLKFD